MGTAVQSRAWERRPRSRSDRVGWWAAGLAGLALVATLGFTILTRWARPEFASMPAVDQIVNPERYPHPQYDVWGTSLSAAAVEERMQTEEGRRSLQPAQGAVAITGELIAQGRQAYYSETFGNEVFLTNVLGIMDGPLKATGVTQAIAALAGGATSNLQVALSADAVIGGRQFRRGDLVDTGLDVAAGSILPLGMRMRLVDGQMQVGITCALCHATVDAESGQVIEGAPNVDLNVGLLMALAPNSTAFFLNTEIGELEEYVGDPARTIRTSHGASAALPDPQRLEDAVDEILLAWPPGQFDSTIDQRANPSKFPNTFTLGSHPYGWNGFARAGPFRGLSMLNNNVHALNADATMHVDAVEDLFGIDKELYLATILQNAADDSFRYDPGSGQSPAAFFDSINPTDSPSLSQTVALPTFPKASFIAPNGLWVSRPGRPVWSDINALSAFENTLRPPRPPLEIDAAAHARGRIVFEQANCQQCHSGPFLTNNRVVPLPEIGTAPKRSLGQRDAEHVLTDPVALPFDMVAGAAESARGIPVPLREEDREQLQLAWALDGQPGGYKTTSLIGLFWSAPYLHDGGVAVGPDASQLGMSGTLLAGVPPDPVNSLRALLDEELRNRVIAANREIPALQRVDTQGIGHPFFVDAERGFSDAEQQDLIHYLLTIEPPNGWREE